VDSGTAQEKFVIARRAGQHPRRVPSPDNKNKLDDFA
jgi:hypothetical protein